MPAPAIDCEVGQEGLGRTLTLEAQWNEKLRALSEAHDEYARRREHDARLLTDEQHSAILALA
jgi:hypothetical protein